MSSSYNFSAQWAVAGAGISYGANARMLWILILAVVGGYVGPMLTQNMTTNGKQVNWAAGGAGIGAAAAKAMGYSGDKVWIGAAILGALGYWQGGKSS